MTDKHLHSVTEDDGRTSTNAKTVASRAALDSLSYFSNKLSFDANDNGKEVLLSDSGQIWRLVDNSGPTWALKTKAPGEDVCDFAALGNVNLASLGTDLSTSFDLGSVSPSTSSTYTALCHSQTTATQNGQYLLTWSGAAWTAARRPTLNHNAQCGTRTVLVTNGLKGASLWAQTGLDLGSLKYKQQIATASPFRPDLVPGALVALEMGSAAISTTDWLNDITGNLCHSASAPTYSASGWSDGTPAVTYAKASNQYNQCNDAIASFTKDAKSYHIAALRFTSVNASQLLFDLEVGGHTTGAQVGVLNTAHPFWFLQDEVSGNVLKSATATLTTGVDYLLAWVRDGAGNITFIVNGTKETISGSDPAGAQVLTGATGLIGITTGSTFQLDAKVKGISAGNGHALTDDEYNQFATRWLGGSFYKIVCDGNSYVAGTGSTNPPTTSISGVLSTLLGPRFSILNNGIGGQQTIQMINSFASAGHPGYAGQFEASPKQSILIGWEICNDFVQNTLTADQALARWKRYVAMCRYAGYKVVALTIVDGLTYTSAHRDIIAAVNSGLRANPGGIYWDGLFDAAGDSLLNDYNNSYRANDKVHFNDSGYALIASRLQGTLAAMGIK